MTCASRKIKALLATLLLAAPLSGANGAGGDSPTELRAFAASYAAAWSSQEPARLAAHYSPGGLLQVNSGEPAVGHAAIEDKARAFMEAFPDMVVELVELTRKGERVEFHWRWTGTNTGPGGTGRRVDLRGYEAWTFGEDGLIRESRGHYDAEEYQRQLSDSEPE